MGTDVELERINNWLRLNLFRVRALAEDGSLTAQYILRTLQLLQENPKSQVTRESMLRHIDAFERAYERREAMRLQRPQEKTVEVSVPLWVIILAVAAILTVVVVVLR